MPGDEVNNIPVGFIAGHFNNVQLIERINLRYCNL